MSAIRLQDAIGEIQDSFILEAYSTTPHQAKPQKWLALLLVAAILALGLIACAPMLFSSISGDDLSFSACYAGNGIVEITVENKSAKVLKFQPKLKLVRWSDSAEIPATGKVTFRNTHIAPESSSVMTVDLSSAYDLGELETPLHNDRYYLILTNNNFLFGQDWMCSVSFSENNHTDEPNYPVQPSPAEADPELIRQVDSDLQTFLGESILTDKEKRAETIAAYYERCAEVIRASGKNVIHPVSPAPTFLIDALPAGIILDRNLPEDTQYQLIGMNETDLFGIIPGEDLCTLVTCTPYGVNTHRLLVRGSRIPYEEAAILEEETTSAEPAASTGEAMYLQGFLLLGQSWLSL